METIGRYQIVREIGRGAMGVVYHAVDPTIARPVAIKTIRIGDNYNPQERDKLRDRLFREARAAGGLSHPNIVTIYDMAGEGELAYIAMEFVDGPSLEQVMGEGLDYHKGRMLRVLHQTAVALDYAHARGIVHRDVKPANILIAADDLVKITDFGIAKATAADQFTMTGTIVGTPNYMAPEQVQGLAVDGRADQFSLAVIAFELLTGEKPFLGEHLTTIVYKIVAEEPAPPHRLNPSLGLRIDAVVRKALSKNPEARFASCTEFLHALEAACDATRGWTLMTRGASASMPTALEQPMPLPPPVRERDEEPVRKRPSALPFLGALLVAGGLIGLIAWQANPTGQKKSESPPARAEAPALSQAESQNKSSAAAAPAPPPPPMAAKPVETPVPAPARQPEPEPQTAQVKPEPPPRQPRRVKVAEPQTLQITTSPAGAAATLDGDAGLSCHTPCSLEVMPGRHSISLVLPGYQQERREIVMADSPQELGYVTLRKLGGTLMLSSTPSGASIAIDGRPRTETTPARLDLAPGTYNVTVEKDGMRKTVRVEIRNGVTKYQPVQLGS